MRAAVAGMTLLTIAILAHPAFAAEVRIGKHSPEELKAVCQKLGGSFSQDAGAYACGTDCAGGPGTDCSVFCKTGSACTAQVIGSRRPKTLEQALQSKRGSH